jgi:hypothetical protein
MSVYLITLVSKGEITQLPDSQKMFGGLIALLYEAGHSEQAISEYVKTVKNDNSVALSNLIPAGYLPTPKTYLVDNIEQGSHTNAKRDYLAIKRRDFVNKQDLDQLLSGKGNPSTDEYVRVLSDTQIRVGIEESKRDIPGLFNNPFSISKVSILKHSASCGEYEEVIKFNVFIRAKDDDLLIAALKDAKKSDYLFTLGNRSSQGYNLFVMTDLDERTDIVFGDNSAYLNLGMLLPGDINLTHPESALDFFTSERRPFSMPGAWNDHQITGKFVSFVTQGSIVIANNYKSAGKSIEAPYQVNGRTSDIVFGNAFLYPLASPAITEVSQ